MKGAQYYGTSHPTEEQLLLLLDGELGSREASEVQTHLQSCWDCRARSQKLKKGIYAFVDYTQECFLPGVGKPPGEWRGFGPLLDGVSSTAKGPRFLFGAWLNRHRQKLATAAVAAGIGTILVIWSMAAPPVLSASEFLQHAQNSHRSLAAKVGKTPVRHRVRIRVDGHSLIRDAALASPRPGVLRDSKELAMQSAFAKAELNWSDPLNPERYATWHESAKAVRDQLMKGDGSLTLTTRADHGVIREASLTVDAADWHPIDESLQLDGGTRIEISEVTEAAGGSPAPGDKTSRTGGVLLTPASDGVSPQEFLGAEMDVRAALHAIGLDLGEQWDIERGPNGGVIVSGMLSTREKLALAKQRLAPIPHITERLVAAPATPPEAATGGDRPTQVIESSLAEPAWKDRLKTSFPDPAARTVFVNDVLTKSDQLLVRVLAAKRLAERYTRQVEADLDDATKRKLQNLLDDHMSRLREESLSLGALLRTLTDLSFQPPKEKTLAKAWQDRVEEAFESIAAIDRLCTELLSGAEHSRQDAPLILKERYSSLRRTLDPP